MALGQELITLDNIREYRDVDTGYSAVRFSAFLKQVQEQDLRNLLGEELWLDFFLNINDSKYQTLLIGEQYVENGETVLYNGLKPFLIWSWLSKLPIDGNVHHTQSGDYAYLHDVTAKPSKYEILQIKEDYKESALIEINNITRYLNQKSKIYTKWDSEDINNVTDFTFDVI
jgi:hypothetical protein